MRENISHIPTTIVITERGKKAAPLILLTLSLSQTEQNAAHHSLILLILVLCQFANAILNSQSAQFKEADFIMPLLCLKGEGWNMLAGSQLITLRMPQLRLPLLITLQF